MSQRITTPFGATSTASDVIAGVDLTGRRAIVTGGASGLGRETARALATAGAEVTVATRNLRLRSALQMRSRNRRETRACAVRISTLPISPR